MDEHVRWVTKAEAAREMEISLSTLDRRIRSGEVEMVREGCRVCVRMHGTEYVGDDELLRRSLGREDKLQRTVWELDRTVTELERERDEAREAASASRQAHKEFEEAYRKEIAEHEETKELLNMARVTAIVLSVLLVGSVLVCLHQASVKEFLLSVLVGLVAFFAALAAAAFVVGTATDSGEVTIDGGTFFSGLLLGGVLGAILHEAVHGVFFLAFGGRPHFGFKPWTRFGPVFYVAAPGSYFDRPRYLAAGVSPAVLLTSVLAVALAFAAADDLLASVVTWAFVLNVAGSSGDMVMMRKVMS